MNMKALLKVLLLFYVVFLVEGQIHAQVPKPHWVKNTIQAPAGGQYIFVYGEGDGSTPDEAYKKAFTNAWIKGQWELEHIDMPSQSIKDVEQNGIEAATRYTKYAIKETCKTDALLYYDAMNRICYKSYVLLQMAKSLDHDFYCLPNNWRNFDAEYSHEVKKYNNKQQSTQTHDKHKYNRNAMLLSLIPGGGWGELYKGQKWGWAIVGSEAALLGGGFACYLIGQHEKNIMDDPKETVNEKQLASRRYDNVYDLQPWLYGGALLIHGLNLIVAYVIDDKNLTFVPTLMPTNDNLAVGIGINYKF